MKHWRANLPILIVFFVTSCAFTGVKDTPVNAHSIAAKQRLRTVEILVACTNGSGGGSGVIIGPRSVLTAAHVVACSGGELVSITVVDVAGGRRAAGVGRISDGDAVRLELARADDLMSPADFVAPRIISVADVAVDDKICVSTALPHRSRSCGTVQQVGPTKMRTTWLGDFGNSGSGVYDEHDQLVGLLTNLVPCNWGGVCGSIINTDIVDLFERK